MGILRILPSPPPRGKAESIGFRLSRSTRTWLSTPGEPVGRLLINRTFIVSVLTDTRLSCYNAT